MLNLRLQHCVWCSLVLAYGVALECLDLQNRAIRVSRWSLALCGHVLLGWDAVCCPISSGGVIVWETGSKHLVSRNVCFGP